MPTLTKVLTIIRGVPGSGKSTLAKKIQGNSINTWWFEADNFFVGADGVYRFDGSKVVEAHEYCMDCVSEAMGTGDPIIVSNTFAKEHDVAPYREMSKEFGYIVQEIWMMPLTDSTHNISEQGQNRMLNRYFNSMCDTAKLWLRVVS